MNRSTRGFVLAVLATTMGTGLPMPAAKVPVAEGRQQGSATGVPAAAGKVLWQFNTNG
jgi:hypothetical protein